MENRYKAVLDFKQRSIMNATFVQNNMDSSVFEFTITDNGVVVDITGQTIVVAFLKADKTFVIQDSTNGVSILDATNGKIQCILKANSLSCVGVVKGEVNFSQGTKKLSTAQFSFNVSPSIDNGEGVLSTNEVYVLDTKIKEATTKIAETEVARQLTIAATSNANTAAASVNEAINEANIAAANANAKANSIQTAADNANLAASSATTAAENANTKAGLAQTAANNAVTATTNANAATTSANSAATGASTATTNANNAAASANAAATRVDEAISTANSSAANANEKAVLAQSAADNAVTATTNAALATDSANGATINANNAAENAVTATNNAIAATSSANDAAENANNALVSLRNFQMIGAVLSWRGNWIPAGWALCNGQLLNISQCPELFSLFGTIYGGDGVTTFALPKLCGQMPTTVDAVAEITNLNIATGCTSDGPVTINLNGTPHNINVLNADTANTVALKIQVAINALPDYNATVNTNIVTITAVNARTEIDATFNGNATGVTGNVSITTQGADHMALSVDNKIVYKIIAIQ